MDPRLQLYGELCEIADVKKKSDANKLLKIISRYQVIRMQGTLDFKKMVQQYKDYKDSEGKHKNIGLNYEKILTDFGKFTKFKSADTIIKDDILRWIRNREKTQKPQVVYNDISKIRCFFRWLEEDGYIALSPCKSIKYKHIKTQRHYIPDKDVEKLRKACSTTFEKAIFEFMISSGCRLSEICSIKLNDVNFSDCTAYVTGKGNKTRAIIFSKEAKKYILEYKKECDDEVHLFSKLEYKLSGNHKTKKYTGKKTSLVCGDIGKVIRDLKVRSKITYSVTPHLLRHTFATQCLNKGMNIVAIQRLLGHSSLSTTQIYAETNIENIKKEYNKVFKKWKEMLSSTVNYVLG